MDANPKFHLSYDAQARCHRVCAGRPADKDNNSGDTELGTYETAQELKNALGEHSTGQHILVMESDDGQVYMDRAETIDGWTGNGYATYRTVALFDNEAEAQAYVEERQRANETDTSQ